MPGMRFTVAIGSLLWLGVVGENLAHARLARITTDTGARLEGEVVSESQQAIVLRIVGIETPVPRESIREVVFRPSAAEAYRQQRDALAEEDRSGRLQLIRELVNQNELALADQELRILREAFPEDEQVELLATVVQERLRLQESRAALRGPAPPVARSPRQSDSGGAAGRLRSLRPAHSQRAAAFSAPAAAAPRQVVDPARLLTDDQIGQLRLWELPDDLRSMRSSILVSLEVVDRFLTTYASDRRTPRGRHAQDEFRRQEAWQQLRAFFRMRARELYPLVQIRHDPPRLLEYRQGIYPGYILPYFQRQFGAGAVPELVLFGSEAGVRGALTNFYILSTVRIDGQPMIHRHEPARSLLLQWGLPREVAYTPAPQVPGWRPFFRDMNDPRFQRFVQWIDSLYNDPEYRLDYTLPTVEDLRPDRPSPGAGAG